VPTVTNHDQYTQELLEKIKDNYDTISTNVKIKTPKRSLAEVDVMAKKGNITDVYEVKSSFRIVKARKQAKLLRKHLDFNNMYFYCGATSSLILL